MNLKPAFIIIGGGAAGFFCAVNAARMHPGLQVILLEKTGKLLSKVKVSGGGRCNVTHHGLAMAAMAECYPRGSSFVKKAFHRFFVSDTIAWFAERGVQLKVEEDGRMFPVTDSSETIIRCLLDEAARYNVSIRLNCEVTGISVTKGKNAERFLVKTAAGHELEADRVCVTVGGYPKASQFDWLRQLGHSIVSPLPSLFTFNMPGNAITGLMGVSVPVARVKIQGTKFQEEGPLLITHWGMSGPVVLRLSARAARDLAACQYHFSIQVNWIPSYNENSLLEYLRRLRFELASQKIRNRNPFSLPARLWEYLLTLSGIGEDTRWADLPSKEQNSLARNLCTGIYEVKGKTTFKEEFVTAGGIMLSEVDPATMQSRIRPGLFFAGEVLDVDGITGGFNFQHAWTSGWIAAASAGI